MSFDFRRRRNTRSRQVGARDDRRVSVLTWNAAIKAIGPQNAVIFSNLIPVTTTFAIEIVRGYRPNAVELPGAALTIGALRFRRSTTSTSSSRASGT
jgi:hypothetical protein